MTRKIPLKVGACLAALALAACGSAEQAPGDAVGAGNGDMMAAGETAAPMSATGEDGFVKLPPQEFVDRVGASDLYEIEAARIAMDKAKSDDVREFASIMLHEHDQAQARLKTAVAEADMGLRYAPKLTPDQQAQLDALRSAGGDFDATYMRQQRAAHEKALAMLHGYAQVGEAQPLREHAQNASEIVAKHLTRAQLLNPA